LGFLSCVHAAAPSEVAINSAGTTILSWLHLCVCAALTSLLETFTANIDNATLPAVFFVCLRVP
jgi:hypothetical protein